jgi:hypothetical protein
MRLKPQEVNQFDRPKCETGYEGSVFMYKGTSGVIDPVTVSYLCYCGYGPAGGSDVEGIQWRAIANDRVTGYC